MSGEEAAVEAAHEFRGGLVADFPAGGDNGLGFGGGEAESGDDAFFEQQAVGFESAVTFRNAATAVTDAFFVAPGTYVLKLTASDGVLSGEATCTVVVDPPPVL